MKRIVLVLIVLIFRSRFLLSRAGSFRKKVAMKLRSKRWNNESLTPRNAKDPDDIMKNYLGGEGLFVFDIIPPRQYVGACRRFP